MNTTNQDQFHPMLGHVNDGVIVRMNNGDTCVIRATMKGWQLYGPDEKPHGSPTASANALAAIVVNYPG